VIGNIGEKGLEEDIDCINIMRLSFMENVEAFYLEASLNRIMKQCIYFSTGDLSDSCSELDEFTMFAA
jgi:hypothetical protein